MLNNKILYLLIFILIASFVFLFSRSSKNQISKVSFNNFEWKVEVVSSYMTRMRGLSERGFLEEKSGLLFVFPDDNLHGIWMKEMNFNIDIIWIDKNFKIVGLEENVSPLSYPKVFEPPTQSRYVLEINSGEAKKAEITIGDTLKFL